MKLFVLQNPKAGRGNAVTDFVPVDGSPTANAPQCHVCGKYISMRPLLPPARVELEGWGPLWGDIAFGPCDQVLVSDKLRGRLAESGLGGLVHFDPVEIVKIRRRRRAAKVHPPGYWLATVARSQALLDAAASGLERDATAVCPECGLGGVVKRLRRIVLQPNTWSGEDVFFARALPGTILTTERFKSLCETASLANCSLVSAEEFGFDYYPHEPGAVIQN